MTFAHHPYTTNKKGHLEIGGVDTTILARKYGTPLYVYDVDLIRQNCQAFTKAFEQLQIKGQVAYASKAFSTIAMVQVIAEEGLNLDVVSEGELYTAIKADFPTEKIHLHGNNKSFELLKMAVDHEIGCIVIDNFHEIQLLEQILQKSKQSMDVLIRVTPGIQSETHRYILTGNEDSKFGFNLTNSQAYEAIKQLHNHEQINLRGIHCHIGSQIFDPKTYEYTVNIIYKHLEKWRKAFNFEIDVLNIGGGFGVRYTKDEQPTPYKLFIEKITNQVKKNVQQLNMPLPEIWIEPGRSIVANAGITLYTVGSIKEIPNVRTYVSVDGGMTDNLRPALYNAQYEGVLANKATEKPVMVTSIAGRCCESGDMLIWDLPLPEVKQNDTLAIFTTGAYGYSMANHYNRFPKPAVVFVEQGKDQLVVRRETYEDVVSQDLFYK